MTILLALLIAVVAISLMMTVLLASTRPLRAYDEPVFGTRSGSSAQKLNRGPHWMELDGAPRPSAVTHAPRPTEQYASALPLPAPVPSRAPETTGSRTASHRVDVTQPRPMVRGSGRINPNTWGRIRAEVGALEIRRIRASSIPS